MFNRKKIRKLEEEVIKLHNKMSDTILEVMEAIDPFKEGINHQYIGKKATFISEGIKKTFMIDLVLFEHGNLKLRGSCGEDFHSSYVLLKDCIIK